MNKLAPSEKERNRSSDSSCVGIKTIWNASEIDSSNANSATDLGICVTLLVYSKIGTYAWCETAITISDTTNDEDFHMDRVKCVHL